MSEQPERIETWAYTVPGSVVPCADFETARQEAEIGNDDEFTSRVVRLTERRNGETIVGPLEMAVIEAAKQIIAEWDERNVPPSRTSAGRQRMESAIRALREARR